MLDMKAIIWLEDYLQTWPTTILVVSHDRLFLNSVVTNVAHMHSERLDMYSGDYEKFAITRVEKLKNQQKEYEAQKQYREHIQVSKFTLKSVIFLVYYGYKISLYKGSNSQLINFAYYID